MACIMLGQCHVATVKFLELIFKNYLPVMNDIMLQVLLLIMIYVRLIAKVDSVKTAFLYGEFGEEIYMSVLPV